MKSLLALVFTGALAIAAATPTYDDVAAAIRQNDLAQLHQLIQSSRTGHIASALQDTPLHYAALYGSPEALQILLQAGANPNAKNQSDVTPLVYAAWSFERTRLLVEHGAAVNAATNQAITPLLVAVSLQGNTDTVRYLLDQGADLNAVTPRGQDALMRASAQGDADTVRLLLERGADAKRKDKIGFNALLSSAGLDSEKTRLLLHAGSDPNAFNVFGGMVKNGPLGLVHITPLMLAAPYADDELVSLLIQAGARVNEADGRKMTPLMLAIATDRAKPSTIRQLIAAGADVQAKDQNGDSALDWANKFGNPEILSLLVAAGAKGHWMMPAPVPPRRAEGSARESIARSFALFSKSDFFRAGGGCAGCHHQPSYSRAYAAAQSAHLPADSHLHSAFLDAQVAERPELSREMPFLTTFGGDYDRLLPQMVANAESGDPL